MKIKILAVPRCLCSSWEEAATCLSPSFCRLLTALGFPRPVAISLNLHLCPHMVYSPVCLYASLSKFPSLSLRKTPVIRFRTHLNPI